jgi:hypothetical protein
MLTASNPRNTAMKVGGKLHGIEMAPNTFFTVVIARRVTAAFWTGPFISRIVNIYIDTLVSHIKFDVVNQSWTVYAHQLSVVLSNIDH